MAQSDEQKTRDATGHLLDLQRHILTRLDDGYGIVRIACTVPQHLEPLWDGFTRMIGVPRESHEVECDLLTACEAVVHAAAIGDPAAGAVAATLAEAAIAQFKGVEQQTRRESTS